MDHLPKIKNEYKNKEEQKIIDIFIKQNWKKTCFQQDITYKEFENLPRRTASDKKIGKKAFNIAKSPKYDG